MLLVPGCILEWFFTFSEFYIIDLGMLTCVHLKLTKLHIFCFLHLLQGWKQLSVRLNKDLKELLLHHGLRIFVTRSFFYTSSFLFLLLVIWNTISLGTNQKFVFWTNGGNGHFRTWLLFFFLLIHVAIVCSGTSFTLS